ncbi:hypothetical protein M6B38_411400 [Iris pallida]|uniref:Uncharacterized protein n=1 Tax=Iris pallida TaxID=29817 RepID=A0AAX6FLC0_IRIPA|nr:hypothetical protein M6B38_411400 [Iris pallida]
MELRLIDRFLFPVFCLFQKSVFPFSTISIVFNFQFK